MSHLKPKMSREDTRITDTTDLEIAPPSKKQRNILISKCESTTLEVTPNGNALQSKQSLKSREQTEQNTGKNENNLPIDNKSSSQPNLSKKDSTLLPQNRTGLEPDTLLKSIEEQRQIKSEIERRIKEKEEQLRKLQMVKTYRTKNNLEELSGLIKKWQTASQEAIVDLVDVLNTEPKPTVEQLLNHLGIDPKLIDMDLLEEQHS